MAQTPKLTVIFCFFPQNVFLVRLVTQNAVFSNMYESIHQKSNFFYSKSVDFYKYIFIVEKQQFSSKMSSGHVGWNLDMHAVNIHKSSFFDPNSEKKNYFSRKKYAFPGKIPWKAYNAILSTLPQGFRPKFKISSSKSKHIHHDFFQNLAFLKNAPGHVECIFDSPAKKSPWQRLHNFSPIVPRSRYLCVSSQKLFSKKFIWIRRKQPFGKYWQKLTFFWSPMFFLKT